MYVSAKKWVGTEAIIVKSKEAWRKREKMRKNFMMGIEPLLGATWKKMKEMQMNLLIFLFAYRSQ